MTTVEAVIVSLGLTAFSLWNLWRLRRKAKDGTLLPPRDE